ncbi:unnamed protein product [Schistocephalus solidus]|uniref:Secreted protein n=1 Tax=Schistocephalus solidus TaxID=70667 RepID=A0A183T5I0_SCHSO|nr:unnamed protein product [Schistocephalus solidus]
MLVLLHEAVICLGYLTAFNEENQVNLCRAGHAPTLLHRLLRLPVAYFSQRELADILFPTLISCGSWTQFERRFPLSKWQEAKGFFQQVQT